MTREQEEFRDYVFNGNDVVNFPLFQREFLKPEQQNYFVEIPIEGTLDDVIMSTANRYKAEKFINEQQHLQMLVRAGLPPKNTLLFFGDSGCGKTYLMSIMAKHLGIPMLIINIGKVLTDAHASDILDDIFETIKPYRVILFMDECDSIAVSRESDSANAFAAPISANERRLLTHTFQLIDATPYNNIICAATNTRYQLDAAFKRRFGTNQFMFQRPKFKCPEEFMEEISSFIDSKKFILVDDSRSTPTMYSDLKNITKSINLSHDTIKKVVKESIKASLVEFGTTEIKLSFIFKQFAINCGIPSTMTNDILDGVKADE